MSRNSLTIIDEYTDRKDLTRLQKWRLRHPEEAEKARQYTKQYFKDHPNHLRDWRDENRERYNYSEKVGSRLRLLKKRGLTEETYTNLLNSQNNSCAICQGPKSPKKDWSIDHCHKTNKTRGILCSLCNMGLGMFKDNIHLLEQAILYLEDHNE